MTTGYRNSAGVDFDNLFDPYVHGTSPPATGYRTSDGVDLAGRFAPISVGSKGPDVGYRTSAGTDVSNLWAAKGTANYALACDGATYNNQALTHSQLNFSFDTTATWALTGVTSSVPSGAGQSGSLVVSPTKFKITTVITGTASGAGSVATGVWADITAGLEVAWIDLANTSPDTSQIVVTLYLGDASNNVLSTTTFTLHGHTVGNS